MENTFKKFDLNKQLLKAVEDLGYTEPSEIQDKAIPLILVIGTLYQEKSC